MLYLKSDALANADGYNIKDCPVYLTNDHKLIEAPSLWIIEIAKETDSEDTLKQYGSTLHRFLQWLDDIGLKAEHWQSVQRHDVHTYSTELQKPRKTGGKRPNGDTIEYYINIIARFYRWARDNGYPILWQLKDNEVSFIIRDSGAMRPITATGFKSEIKAPGGRAGKLKKAKDLLVRNEDYVKISSLFDDDVYRVIMWIMRETGLRVRKGLLELPYCGTGENAGLRRYRENELENLKTSIPFCFRSKGKDEYDIQIPVHVWAEICKVWMPIRTHRDELYAKTIGKGFSAGNSVLFLTKTGKPVNYTDIWKAFNRVSKHPECPVDKFHPHMLRHSFATYFVMNLLKKRNELGHGYLYNAEYDAKLRQRMGHASTQTTYKFYVNMVNTYTLEDIVGDFVDSIAAGVELSSVVEPWQD